MSSPDHTRRWVATLIVLVLVLRLGSWLWASYRPTEFSQPTAAKTALQRKIAASHAYDNALLQANALLDQQDTVAASHLLDSLRQQPTDSLFQIEQQKLAATRQRLDSLRSASTTHRL